MLTQYLADTHSILQGFDSVDEQKAMLGTEFTVAKALGEIPANGKPRNNHAGEYVSTLGNMTPSQQSSLARHYNEMQLNKIVEVGNSVIANLTPMVIYGGMPIHIIPLY